MKFQMDWGVYGLFKLIECYDFSSILDIGSGAGEHKRFLEYFDKDVISVDFDKSADYRGDFMEIDFDRKFEAIWCSHVLEHQRNVGAFLDKCFDILEDDGVLAICVPRHSQEVLITGHLTAWSMYLLCYNLIMAGFDCSEAKVLDTYDICLLVRKKKAHVNPLFKHSVIGEGEDPLATIEKYFPMPASQGSQLTTPGGVNWGELLVIPDKPVSVSGRFVNV